MKETTEIDKINNLTQQIIDAGLEVHRHLGPGLLESIYEDCLASELQERGLAYERQKPVPLLYKGRVVAEPMRLDLIVENRVIVELKAVEKILPIHQAQLLTYLKLAECSVGLLLNFHCVLFKDGIKRMVNHLEF